jgi:ubiquinone biosynthesis protein
VGEPIFGKSARDMAMSRVLLQLFEITELFHMRLRPELVLLQKTMVQAEGVARALDPELDIWAVSRPIVERFLRRELGAESVIEDAADDLRRLRAAARHLPQAMQDMSSLAAAWRNGAVALDSGTVDALSRRMSRSRRASAVALWVIALAALALTFTVWLD